MPCVGETRFSCFLLHASFVASLTLFPMSLLSNPRRFLSPLFFHHCNTRTLQGAVVDQPHARRRRFLCVVYLCLPFLGSLSIHCFHSPGSLQRPPIPSHRPSTDGHFLYGSGRLGRKDPNVHARSGDQPTMYAVPASPEPIFETSHGLARGGRATSTSSFYRHPVFSWDGRGKPRKK